MNEMKWVEASAPSNIALIKYMGKQGSLKGANVSTNASLSFTLDHLRTRVRVRWESGLTEPLVWRPLVEDGFHAPNLSSSGRERFLRHADRCRWRFENSPTSRTLVVESANDFPSDCGLASSASSFAALTLAMAKLFDRDVSREPALKELAELSREGSGSSCRSMFSPWALWKSTGAEPIHGLPRANQIRHLAVIVDEEKKAVSSSEAHVRVTSSLLFRGRIERAEERLRQLVDDLQISARDESEEGVLAWNRAVQTVWTESWDMHALFETSNPPFGYFTEGSIRTLNLIREISAAMSETSQVSGRLFRQPMVTMDAGPNVHVLLWNDPWTDEVVGKIKSGLGSMARVIDSFEVGR